MLLCLRYAQTDFKDWEGLPKNPSICNGDKGMIGLVVQLAILLQIFGGRRGDDVLHISYMHAKLEAQPTDQVWCCPLQGLQLVYSCAFAFITPFTFA